MTVARYGNYACQILTSPPAVTWRKIQRRVVPQTKRKAGRLRARWFDTTVADGHFFRALSPAVATREAFQTYLQTRQAPAFFLAPAARDERLALLNMVDADAADAIIAAADRVCDHVFDLLGSGPTELGPEIDWHTDFKSGHRWDPQQYYLDITSAPFPGGYDLKVPWELSRCQHFVWLGQAYWLTNDEKYAAEFIAQVTSWIEQNPPRLGVNWGCAMDVAIRVVNWLWGCHFFAESPQLTAGFRLAFHKSLLAHGRHIMDNLEWSETLTSNHYLSNIVGLVYLGILAPEFKEAKRWRDFGLQELHNEMFKQVYPDGADFEASTSYHRLVTELFLSATLLAQLNGHSFDPDYLARLEGMIDFVQHVTKPDGTVPLIGDSDDGQLHRLQVWADAGREWLDHRYLLAIGAVLFKRADFAQAAGEQWTEAVWLMGDAVRNVMPAQAAPQTSYALSAKAFADTGLYIMRHDDAYMIVNAGINGQNGNAGHSHNDALSFELYAGGHTWIVDPGSYIYTADYAARNQFRSTIRHNTIMVAETEQNRSDPTLLFTMCDDTHPCVHQWDSSTARDILVLEHDGYSCLPQDVCHKRQFVFDKKERRWQIQDTLTGNGTCQIDLFLQVDCQTMDVSEDGHTIWLRIEGIKHSLKIAMTQAIGGAWQCSDALYAPSYGQTRPIQRLTWTANVTLPVQFDWLIQLEASIP